MEYSAGMVSCLFWLNETINTIPYYLDNTPVSDMRKIAVEQNLYQVRKEDRCRRIAGVVYKRLHALTPKLIAELRNSDINTARIVHIISIMKSDLLFFEFMNLVFKKSLQLGKKNLDNSDIKNFFDDKRAQSAEVAGFSESAISKLKQTYVKFLIESGLVENAQSKKILTPYIDYRLQELLKQTGYGIYLSTITGIEL
ncbi:MAG: DUF1819 family protein [Treponema sp.]|nr:DUF1819 family protein [Treponema sp.]